MEFLQEDVTGNTPLIDIRFLYRGEEKHVYVKLEYFNVTGSIKDRIASYILKRASEKGELHENQAIVEATSGNTGISFSALGKKYSHMVHIFMPDWVSKERMELMKLYGAEVHLVSKEDGGFLEAIKRADDLALKIGGYRPDQFNNYDNVLAHYYTTGKEITEKLDSVSGFVSGIGTGGTLMGVAKKLRECFPDVKIIALEPSSLPVLTTGKTTGEHLIEGIGDEFIPSIVKLDEIDEIVQVNDLDALNMARKLSMELGLGVGISSGANFLVAATNNTPNLVTVFPDDSKKYLSTKLKEPIDLNEKFLSNQIELLDFKVVK